MPNDYIWCEILHIRYFTPSSITLEKEKVIIPVWKILIKLSDKSCSYLQNVKEQREKSSL